MPRLVPVEVGELAHLDAIIRGKHRSTRTRLELIKPLLRDRYREYAGTTLAFHNLSPSTLAGTEADDCAGCYALDRKPVAALKQLILDARPQDRRSLCQWCLIDTWSEIDHYVPKETFPEFAVLARNLAPCCAQCNRDKSDYWPPIGGAPPVLSLYYSALLDEPHLVATVTHSSGQPSTIRFSIRRGPPLTAVNIAALEAHYAHLKLMPRLESAGLQALADFRRSLREHGVARPQAQQFLMEEAASWFSGHGPNHYRALTAVALAIAPTALDDYLT